MQAGEPYNSKRPLAVAGVTGAVDISVGYEHSYAATELGEVFCWGTNKYGELGDGTLTDRAPPVKTLHVNSPELPPAENGFQGLALLGDEQIWEGLPEPCRYAETLDMEHSALLRESFQVESAIAGIDSQGMITVRLANYPLLRERRTIDPRGDQLMTIIYFIKIKDPEAEKEERLPADAGEYGISTETARYTGAMSAVRNSHTSYELRWGVADDSNVVLSYVGDDWVCGTLNVTNKYGHMKGEFAAAVLK